MNATLIRNEVNARELMVPNPVSLDEHISLQGAAAAMTSMKVSAAPVINAAGRPLGVVSQLYKTPLAGAELAITVDDFDMSGDLAFVTCIVVAKSDPADAAPKLVRSVFVFRFDDWHNQWKVREHVIDWKGLDVVIPAHKVSDQDRDLFD